MREYASSSLDYFSPQHRFIPIIDAGAKKWNEWRTKNPEEHPNLQFQEFNGLNFAGINLSGVELNLTKWNHVNLSNANLDEANFRGAKLSNTCLDGVSLRGTDFTSAHLESLTLDGLNFSDSVIKSAKFDKASLERANFDGLRIRGASFKGANLRGANFKNAYLEQVDFSGADLTGACFQNTDFLEVNLSYANLENANFADAKRLGANLKGSILIRANFGAADLCGAQLQGAALNGANFRKAVLSSANLSNANLSGANLVRSNLLNANLELANLTGACIENCKINGDTQIEGIVCDYIYLKEGQRERCPHDTNRTFATGEFEKLLEQSLESLANKPIHIHNKTINVPKVDVSMTGDTNIQNNDFRNATLGGGVAGRDYQGNVTHYHQQQNLIEAASYIKNLLQELEQDYPSDTLSEKAVIAEKAIEKIQNAPNWKEKITNAIKAMGVEAFMEAIDHPIANVFRAGIEAFRE